MHFANLAVVLLVSLGVLFKPELGVGDGLVHAGLQVFVSGGLSGHLCLHVGGLLGQVCLGAQHHVLHLPQIFFVLVELIFQSHRSVDSLLQVYLGLVNFLRRCLELLVVVGVD